MALCHSWEAALAVFSEIWEAGTNGTSIASLFVHLGKYLPLLLISVDFLNPE
jgi:hypothetical protein